MGLIEKNLNKAQGVATRRVQQETAKLNKQLADFEESVVDRLNWLMKATQELCNKLDIKLDDPLEDK